MESDLVTCDTSRLFYRYLIPSIGGTLVTSIYSFVDTIAVGQACGPEGTAAIAVINPIFALACFFGLLTGVGGSVEISRLRGAGDNQEARGFFTVSIAMLLSAAAVLWLLCLLFLPALLRFSGADEVLLPYAMAYTRPLVLVFPLLALNSYLGAAVRSDENPDLVLRSVILGGVFNIFGDWFFVFPLGMGMLGAGLATSMGIVIHSLALLSHFRTRDKGTSSLVPVRVSRLKAKAAKVTASGTAASLPDVSLVIITILMNNQAMRYGTRDDLAVLGVIVTISFLFQHIFSGIGQAALPIVSANLGGGKTERVRESFRLLLFWAFLLGALSTALCVLFPEAILRLFMDTTESVMERGPSLTALYSLSFLLLSVNTNIVLFLEAVQRPYPALALSTARALLLSGVLLVILPPVLGAEGICWAMTGAEALTAVFALPYALKLVKNRLPA